MLMYEPETTLPDTQLARVQPRLGAAWEPYAVVHPVPHNSQASCLFGSQTRRSSSGTTKVETAGEGRIAPTRTWRSSASWSSSKSFILYLPKALHPCNPGSSAVAVDERAGGIAGLTAGTGPHGAELQ